MISPTVFNVVRIAHYLVFLLVFYFHHCHVCDSSIYGFRLLLWYLETFLIILEVTFIVIEVGYKTINI